VLARKDSEIDTVRLRVCGFNGLLIGGQELLDVWLEGGCHVLKIGREEELSVEGVVGGSRDGLRERLSGEAREAKSDDASEGSAGHYSSLLTRTGPVGCPAGPCE